LLAEYLLMAENDAAKATNVGFEGVNPILRVSNLAASVDYFVNVLGFKLDWQASTIFASVSRGRCGIFLSEGDQGHFGSWVWIGVQDVDRLYADYRARGAKIRYPPSNYSWACEMQVEDLDGNVLRMGSDTKPDEPFGEWLDMHGVRWSPLPGGGWTRVEGN
jgi:catechol 2,3-dioxygenase-like lactoylglutathione lyase family enzyme